jgi:fluoride ion exporter CrcB/FEX
VNQITASVPTEEEVGSRHDDHSEEQVPYGPSLRRQAASRLSTQLYTISYLIFFSILGTLARLGLQWLTFYPGAPVTTPVLWANFAGSLFIGFLAEDRRLFKQEWGSDTFNSAVEKFQLDQTTKDNRNENCNDDTPKSDSIDPIEPASPPDNSHTVTPLSPSEIEAAQDEASRAHAKVKKTIPLYIGLATGFCGSLTSFSSFIRDAFLALSNNLPNPTPTELSPSSTNHPLPRNGGYSFMALIAVILLTLSLTLSALKFGAHLAIALDPLTPTLSFRLLRKALDRLTLFLGPTTWLAAILLSLFAPARHTWRGQALFATVFAPVGCLVRFYASLHLNALAPSFPVGTFAVNLFGTAVLGACWDLQHLPFRGHLNGGGGSVLGCQVLQGIMDGFCGALTTVSTFVSELNGLRRVHAWTYGAASVVGGLAVMLVVMGSVRWSESWVSPVCVT